MLARKLILSSYANRYEDLNFLKINNLEDINKFVERKKIRKESPNIDKKSSKKLASN